MDDLDQVDGTGARHVSARHMAEQALAAEAAGDQDEADRLFAVAERVDAEAVVAVLAEHADDAPTGVGEGVQDDEEVAAMSRTVVPGADAPSRAGVSGRGSGADTVE